MLAQKQGELRRNNQLLIVNMLRAEKMARVELARRLDMSGPGISKHIDALIGRGIVMESGMQSSGLGRRRVLLDFNAKCGCVCAVELCAHTARLAIANLQGEVLEKAELEPFETLDSLVLARVVKQMGKLLSAQFADAESLLGICLMNGHVPRVMPENPEGMLLALAELKKVIGEKYQCPVFLEHSSRMAAVGESLQGGKKTGRMIYIYVGDTVSGSLTEGQSYAGMDWSSGMFGGLDELIPDALSAVAEWRSGGASTRNTLGEQVTLPAIVQLAAEKFTPGEGYLGEQAEDADSIALEDICAGVENGDSACVFAVQNAAVRLGVSIVNLSCYFDFDEVVIGGPIERMGEAWLGILAQFLNDTFASRGRKPLTVRWSALGDQAMLYGGAIRAADGAVCAILPVYS